MKDYPFGMAMNGREFNADKLSNGFNGQMKDKDIEKSHHTARYWEYDTRIGRRWNMDPKPVGEGSRYAVLDNAPILNQDPLGDFFWKDHRDIDRQAFQHVYGKSRGALLAKLSTVTTLYKETLLFWVNNVHLDNKSNVYMRKFLEKGGYMKLRNHTLQDFYSHSNYVEIMRENGYTDKTMVTFDKLDPKSEIFKIVMSKIETTNYRDKGQANGHDGKIVGSYTELGKRQQEGDETTVPSTSDGFMAKDANGVTEAYKGFKHPSHDVAKRLAVDATISKLEGTTINNAQLPKKAKEKENLNANTPLSN